MEISIKLPDVAVVQSNDYKGNPVTYLEILGTQVLFAYGEEPQNLSPESWEDIFRYQLGHILADLILNQRPDLEETWKRESPTGREVYTRNRDVGYE